MELRQLRYFIGVAEAGSLLRASASLHIAQPALGQQMAALEDDVGAKLFERSSRGMKLTEAGKTFLEHARVVLADVARAREAVRETSTSPGGDVVIGLTTTVALAATVPIVLACRERLPRVRLKVIEAYSGFLREWLLSGRLDLAIVYGDQPDAVLAKRPLLDEQLALVADTSSPPLKSRLTLHEVMSHELVLPSREHGLRRIIDEACAPHGLEPKLIAEIDSLPSVKQAVASGLGCTILPIAAVAREVEEGRLQAATIVDERMIRRVVFATHVARPSTAASAAVHELATGVIGQMVESGRWPGRWIGPRPGP